MEKSIETIWKAGFLDRDALVAPQVNNLYNRKSEHIIEKFKRMFRFNLKAIAIGGVLGLIGLFLLQMPITGIVMFLTLVVVFVVNQKELNALETIDQSVSSYDYLKAFDAWMKYQISLNGRMARFYYPAIFVGTVLGLWLSVRGPRLFEMIAGPSESAWLINGIPGMLLFPVLFIAGLLGIFGDRLYAIELNAFYGRVLKKLEELLADMETLRKA
jgi:hypothetical protein